MVKQSRPLVSVDPKAYLLASAALLLFPFIWISSWLLAVFIHELGHYLAVILCRRKIPNVRIGITGVLMESDRLTPIESVLCSLSGPTASALLIIMHRSFPRLAICGFLQAIYNLLPICPLDGGQTLKAITTCLFGDHNAAKIIAVTEYLLMITLFLCCIYITVVLKLGFVPITLFLIFLIKHQKIKIPCKAWLHRVQ